MKKKSHQDIKTRKSCHGEWIVNYDKMKKKLSLANK